MVRKLKESVYSVTYCYDDEWSGSGCSEEEFEGSWLELQDYISRLKANGYYNINASFLYDEDDVYDESVQKSGKNLNEDFDDKQYSIDNILAWLQDAGSKGARKITDFFGKGIILSDDTESFLQTQPVEALVEFEKEVGIDFDSVFGRLDRDGYLESKQNVATIRIQEELSVDDEEFKEAVKDCDGSVDSLAFELWKRYIPLEDAISSIKSYYENGKGRISLPFSQIRFL